jgi:hypothetical protein
MRLGTGTTRRFSLMAGAVFMAGAAPLFTADFASGQSSCDFVTGGGFILRDSGAHGNFGAAGGCKNGGFWGHLNYLDHGTTPPFHVHGTGVTGYFFIDPMTRDISGTAETNDPSHPNVNYCVEVSDNETPGGKDTFVIQLKDQPSGVPFYTTKTDSDHTLHGGDIELHKPNPSTTGSFSSGSCLVTACAGTPSSCGTNGACVTCGPGAVCSAGACACAGTPSSCGVNGACVTCGPGAVCSAGACACAGTPSSCGVNGACATCAAGQSCTNSQCCVNTGQQCTVGGAPCCGSATCFNGFCVLPF